MSHFALGRHGRPRWLPKARPPFRLVGHILPRGLIALLLVAARLTAQTAVQITVDHNRGPAATRAFKFEHVASPAKDDAAAHAKLTLIAGTIDRNGGDLGALTDGLLPVNEDEPGANLFFRADSWGGRFRLDLGSAIDIGEIRTYSWHADSRAPQLYYLYASDGTAPNFNPAPDTKTDPVAVGWKRLAFADTRPKEGDAGGQYAVSLTDATGSLGNVRYLLFDVFETESEDAWGNTFFSEVDVAIAPRSPRGRSVANEPNGWPSLGQPARPAVPARP